MLLEKDFAFPQPQLLCYEGDEGASNEPSEQSSDESTDSSDSGGNEPKFTQEQLNRFLAEDRRKNQEKLKKQSEQFTKMEKQLQNMIARESTTAQERASLEADLEELRATQRTAEQQREHEVKKAAEKHQRELEEARNAATNWETMFKKSSIERAIMDAANEHDAFNANDFIALLGPRAEMREQKDKDGNPTGQLVPMVAVDVKDEETGEILKAWKTPSDAVKSMKESPDQHGNKFRDSVIAGIGGGTASSSGGKGSAKVDPTKLSMEEKARLFRENPEALGLPPRRR